MKNPIFIVLEGLNGAGKSTIGKLLSERLNCVLMSTPSQVFRDSRQTVDENADPMARFLFYLAGVYQTATEIAEHIRSGRSVVCDRYILSTLCSNRAGGLTVEVPNFLELIAPNYSFLITCEQEVRLSRMGRRGMNINDLRERRGNIEARTMQEFRRYDFIEIDNSCEDPNFAVGKIIEHIEK